MERKKKEKEEEVKGKKRIENLEGEKKKGGKKKR